MLFDALSTADPIAMRLFIMGISTSMGDIEGKSMQQGVELDRKPLYSVSCTTVSVGAGVFALITAT